MPGQGLRYIQLRDETCTTCGTGPTEDNRLEIHHIDKNRQNNIPSNHLIVCNHCHIRIHHPDVDWRRKAVKRLHGSGMTFQATADALGVSRQRCHQIWKMRNHKTPYCIQPRKVSGQDE